MTGSEKVTRLHNEVMIASGDQDLAGRAQDLEAHLGGLMHEQVLADQQKELEMAEISERGQNKRTNVEAQTSVREDDGATKRKRMEEEGATE